MRNMRGKILSGNEMYLSTPEAKQAGDDAAAIVARALRWVGAPIKYHLEYPNGGTDPGARSPDDPETAGCDCVGFAAWAGGFDRFQPLRFPLYDGYINTDSMIEEADNATIYPGNGKVEHGKVWFSVHPEPVAGCFIVGQSFRVKWPPWYRVIGHIGVVTDTSEWATKGLAGIHVAHCSPYNYQFTKGVSAVWKTSALLWKNYPTLRFISFNRARFTAN